MIKRYTFLALLLLVLLFVLQNTSVVQIRFLFWQRDMSQVIALLATLFAGFLLGLTVAALKLRKHS